QLEAARAAARFDLAIDLPARYPTLPADGVRANGRVRDTDHRPLRNGQGADGAGDCGVALCAVRRPPADICRRWRTQFLSDQHLRALAHAGGERVVRAPAWSLYRRDRRPQGLARDMP